MRDDVLTRFAGHDGWNRHGGLFDASAGFAGDEPARTRRAHAADDPADRSPRSPGEGAAAAARQSFRRPVAGLGRATARHGALD